MKSRQLSKSGPRPARTQTLSPTRANPNLLTPCTHDKRRAFRLYRNVHCELPQCSARMWAGGCNLGLPS